MNTLTSNEVVDAAREECDRAMAQGNHYGHPSALVNATRDLIREIERMRSALRGVMECTGTSTRQYHIARDALDGQPSETGPVDYIQFGWIPYHEKQGCDPDSYVEHEEDRTEIIDGWRWVPAYAAVGSVKAAPERCRSCLGYQGENLLETQCTLSEGHSGPHQYASDPRPAQKAEVVHHPGCWKLHSPSGQGNCNCDAENGDER